MTFLQQLKNLSPTSKKAISDLTLLAISQIFLFYGVKYILARADPSRQSKDQLLKKSRKVMKSLGVDRKTLELDDHEAMLIGEVVQPDEIDVGFSDVGGLDPIINDLKESIIFPLCYPTSFKSSAGLFSSPKGVLLYGPPGCGKTMLAKTLAKESGAMFINIKPSDLSSKWFGESSKLVAALFSLSRKLQPSIIFIDEIDSFMRERSRTDHELFFLFRLWDGLATGSSRILVLGATNRPNDIDPAILRRMPKRIPVGLPDLQQRTKILKLLLKDIKMEEGLSVESLAEQTVNYSGSDLKEFCRSAVMAPIKEYVRGKGGDKLAMVEASSSVSCCLVLFGWIGIVLLSLSLSI
ncbi:adenosinetriphosphatase [Puccinia sorghi]|uniref:Adenosinetriphosphatase n=1 Tax=Puccinia sorghi TaxID=27349 RepID=A0A0L6UE41_9BASI|nr:adenosinetriphosphatase [Puccinia sorghi]